MKTTNNIIVILLMLLAGFVSCQDEAVVDLANRPFVRINKTSVSLSAGERYIVKASVDTLGSASKTFSWSIMDPTVATIEPIDNITAIITALTEGTTVIKIESTDNQLMYFSNLYVSKDRVFKVLTIGGTPAEDAVENYLYNLAANAGKKLIIGNLYL
ncbi:MAG: Ig-like domain-containing protein, partial [Petrimonas sp.]|nr:Ig-like domain-containing protein [Petrimonas sp.]